MKNIAKQFKQLTSDPIITFKENNRTMRFINSARLPYIKVHVDNEAVTSGPRCDFLLTTQDEISEHFIELKGKNIGHAIKQLRATIELAGEHTTDRHSYIVSTNQAPALKTSVQQAKIEFRKRFRSTLDIREKLLEVKLS